MPTKGIPFKPTQKELVGWRHEVWKRDHDGATWSSAGILSNSLVELLSSIGPITERESLKQLLARRWLWWDRYGEELTALILRLDTKYEPIPAENKKTKRKANSDSATGSKRLKDDDLVGVSTDPDAIQRVAAPGTSSGADMGGRFIDCKYCRPLLSSIVSLIHCS